jgi:MFS family permease
LITRRLVNCLGFSQLVCWGISYYLIGGFGELIAADLGWGRALVYGGFSASLAVMGLASRLTGKLIDRHGGRSVMAAGSALIALGCAMLSFAHGVRTYYAAWLVLGLAMRLTLYEAAFAALARIGGPAAKRPISQITLLGGLASTVFWPIGNFLAGSFGWRGAVLVYAGIALATIPVHLSIPDARYAPPPAASGSAGGSRAGDRHSRLVAGLLYATSTALANFMNSSMSSQMIGILVGLGLASSVAVSVATLRGIGQSAARLCEFIFGGRLDPLDLNIVASLLLPISFTAGLFGGASIIFAVIFALLYGAGNGLLTITRGTLPLILFDPREYGAVAGGLLMPSFLAAAASPLICAVLAENMGDRAVLYLCFALGCGVLFCALILRFTVARLRKH